MTYWTASAAARPASRTLAAAFVKTIALSVPLTVALALALGTMRSRRPTPHRRLRNRRPPPSRSRPTKPKPRKLAAAGSPARRRTGRRATAGGAGPGGSERPAAGAADLFALDQILPQGRAGPAADPNAKEVCFTGKDARVESGQPVVAAVLIEPQGEDKKILRVTLPLGMQLVHGTRVIVDQNQPMTAPYVICFTNGCMADYEANAEMIGKMKKGQGLSSRRSMRPDSRSAS